MSTAKEVFKSMVGKTIEAVERSMYYDRVSILFTDGTAIKFRAGTTSAHNESWGTIEVELQKVEPNV